MSIEVATVTRAEEFFRHHDAKDADYLHATFADDAQAVDEIARSWFRGRAAMDTYLRDNLPRIEDMHSVVEDYAIARWDDVEIETFMLRQHYVFDGAPYDIEAPTTMIWRRDEGAWTLALVHTVPLEPAS